MSKIKKLLSGLLLVLFLMGVARAESPSEVLDSAFYKALGDTFTQVFEEGAGIPASGLATMAGYFAAGDISAGLLEASKVATSVAIGKIPVLGPAIFVIQLESALIAVGKAYLDAYMVDIAWERFKNLPPVDQQAWVRGEYVAEMDAALGAYYTERNVANLRLLFGYYLERERQKEMYLQKAAEIIELLNAARYMEDPEPFQPEDGATVNFSQDLKLKWWANGANFFRVTMIVDGHTYYKFVELPEEENPSTAIVSLSLGEMGVNWEEVFRNTTEPVEVQWKIHSACVDKTGLVAQYVGAQYVVGSHRIIRLPESDPVKESGMFTFLLQPPQPPVEVEITSPANGTETPENQVEVHATVRYTGEERPEIRRVGFLVNGAYQLATLENGAFSSIAVLATGENRIVAKVETEAGTFLSDPITVVSTAVLNSYHIRIIWDKNDTDVDLHFAWSGGAECYYRNKTPDWGGENVSPRLDVDNTSGYGPENITIEALPGPGHYRIYVHYYSDHGNGGTNVTATIYKNGQPIFSETRYMESGETWTLLEFDIAENAE